MTCHNCKDEAIKNHANNKEFYYCRTCKIEVVAKTEEQEVFEIAKEWESYSLDTTNSCVCYNPHVICWLHARSAQVKP